MFQECVKALKVTLAAILGFFFFSNTKDGVATKRRRDEVTKPWPTKNLCQVLGQFSPLGPASCAGRARDFIFAAQEREGEGRCPRGSATARSVLVHALCLATERACIVCSQPPPGVETGDSNLHCEFGYTHGCGEVLGHTHLNSIASYV